MQDFLAWIPLIAALFNVTAAAIRLITTRLRHRANSIPSPVGLGSEPSQTRGDRAPS